jgi:hypothetical protein
MIFPIILSTKKRLLTGISLPQKTRFRLRGTVVSVYHLATRPAVRQMLRECRKPGFEESRRENFYKMKKIFFLLLVLISFNLYGQPGDLQLLQNFVNSEDYSQFIANSQFSTNGAVNLDSSNVSHQEHPSLDGKVVPVLNVSFTQTQNDLPKIVGQIQAIKVRDDYHSLPNSSRYLMVYKDFREYNHSTQTGQIKIYDLNYDEYLVIDAAFTNGSTSSIETFPMPPVVIEKYGLDPNRGTHPCDANQNGNVTFGECWRCMVNACFSNPECNFRCFAANHFGQQCSMAIAISCTWIAIWY